MVQIDDEAQLTFATAHGWMLLSHNERDFRRLHHAFQASGRAHGGVIVVTRRSSFVQRIVRVQEKGQVTLPADMRRDLNLRKGGLGLSSARVTAW